MNPKTIDGEMAMPIRRVADGDSGGVEQALRVVESLLKRMNGEIEELKKEVEELKQELAKKST
jgi:HAMP domain-containing protein